MRIGLDLPPHFRVFGAFFVYSSSIGGIFPRRADIQAPLGGVARQIGGRWSPGVGLPLMAVRLIAAGAPAGRLIVMPIPVA